MKSERRHELQTNELADWVGNQLQKHRDRLPTIGLALVAIIAAIVMLTIWGARRGGSTANAWQEYDQAAKASDLSGIASRLKQVSAKYPDTIVALWARLDLADVQMLEGKYRLETDRENGVARLREAREIYAEVLRSPKLQPEMIRRAALCEAKCLELLGERAQAIEAYRAIAEKYGRDYPEIADDARSRASDLEQSDAANFYAWLAEYKPPTRPLTPPSLDSTLPPFDDGMEGTSGSEESPGPADGDTSTEESGAMKPEEPDSEEGTNEPAPGDKPTDDPGSEASPDQPKPADE